MPESSLFAAELLETSASAYAACAASLLLERHPEVGERFAPHAMRDWKTSLTQRVLELSAALGVAEPRLFASRVRWAEQAFRAQERLPEDLRTGLVCLRDALHEELPEAAGKESSEYIDLALRSFGQPPPAETMILDPQAPNGRLVLRYLQSVLEGDARGAVDLVVDAVADGLDPHAAYLDVLIPAQIEVGEMWHRGELCVAEEHYVTATTERAMSIIAQNADRSPANGKTVLAAGAAGNTHSLGVRVIADFFEMAGWRVICLGANVPLPDLAAATQSFGADLIVLSAARIHELKAVHKTIEALRRPENRELKVLVGGAAFSEVPELWRQLGADGHAGTADEAVAAGARVLGLA